MASFFMGFTKAMRGKQGEEVGDPSIRCAHLLVSSDFSSFATGSCVTVVLTDFSSCDFPWLFLLSYGTGV